MQQIKTRALVIRTADYGEYDKMLTLLSSELGKISVVAKGAKSIKHGSVCTNMFCYGDYVLTPKGDIFVYTQGVGIEYFMGLSNDLERFDCACTIASFAGGICHEHQPVGDILRILLNALHVLSNTDKPALLVKTAFYLRSVAYMGIEPELYSCSACGNEDNLYGFSDEYGGTLCAECAKQAENTKKIGIDELALMKYICSADIKKLYSFTAHDKVLERVFDILQAFVYYHLDLKI